jgi:hypothetical protein
MRLNKFALTHRIVAKVFEGNNDETPSEHIDGRNHLRFSTIEQFSRGRWLDPAVNYAISFRASSAAH